MLVLTRKMRQKIQIGPNISITILRIKGSAVRIGIEAPKGIRVFRSELVDESVGMLLNDELKSAEGGFEPRPRISVEKEIATLRDAVQFARRENRKSTARRPLPERMSSPNQSESPLPGRNLASVCLAGG